MRTPSYILFYPTARCNARCRHCYTWLVTGRLAKEPELSVTEIEKIAKRLNRIYTLVLSGGEPSLREDLDVIVKVFYRYNRVRKLWINTNGFQTERIVFLIKEILKDYPNCNLGIFISIDDLWERHDKLRNFKGGFQKAIETIEQLKHVREFYQNLKLYIQSTYSGFNEFTLEETHKFIHDVLGLYHHIIYIGGKPREQEAADITDINRFSRLQSNIFTSNLELFRKTRLGFRDKMSFAIERVKEECIKKFLEGEREFLPCRSGRDSIIIYSNGEVSPCDLRNDSFGNLRDFDYDMRTLLRQSKVKRFMKKFKKESCSCINKALIDVNVTYNPRLYLQLIKTYWNIFKDERKEFRT